MKYVLNELENKTTNNFRVNNIALDLELRIPTFNHNFDITESSGIVITNEIVAEKLTSKIGLTFDKYYKLNIIVKDNILEPIIINYNFSNNDALVTNINIAYEKNTCADFIIKYNSVDDNNHFAYTKENILCDTDSHGTITFVNNLNNNANNFYAIEGDTKANANITHNIIDLSGNIRLYNSYQNAYDNSKQFINMIYYCQNHNILDINYVLNSIGKTTENNIEIEGALNDESTKNFRGTIDFKSGCTGSFGKENENALLLSDNTKSKSVPILLCSEEDVSGFHSASNGKIDEEKIFYLMSRGYSQKQANILLIKANYNKVISILPKTIQEEIITKIDSILG